ncbi:MAG: hypothetical protein MUE34_03825 [Acidimicrobiales bacterium]|nr:hypothetical protein [Acidimicrobiales bacterium]
MRGASTGAIFPRSSSPAFARSGLAVPSRPGAPRTAAEARRRRREVLLGLGGAAVFTLVLGLLVGGIFWVLHLLVDIALVGFGYLVHEHETRAQERAEKVRPLPMERRAPRQAAAEEPLRRRAAN